VEVAVVSQPLQRLELLKSLDACVGAHGPLRAQAGGRPAGCGRWPPATAGGRLAGERCADDGRGRVPFYEVTFDNLQKRFKKG